MKLLIYLFIALTLTGCRASTKASEQTHIMQQSETGSQDSGRINLKDLAGLEGRIEQLKDEAEELDITITADSRRDTTGHTHQTASATIQYRRKSDKQTREDSQITRNTELRAIGTRNTTLQEQIAQSKTEHKKKPPGRWHIVAAAIIVIAIGYAAYRKQRKQ